MQYTEATNETMLAFANNIVNPDGGTHASGFKTSLTRAINSYAKKRNLLKGLTPSGDDLREGLTSVLSVRLPDPQFNNQTKEKLLSPEMEKFVSQACRSIWAPGSRNIRPNPSRSARGHPRGPGPRSGPQGTRTHQPGPLSPAACRRNSPTA